MKKPENPAPAGSGFWAPIDAALQAGNEGLNRADRTKSLIDRGTGFVND